MEAVATCHHHDSIQRIRTMLIASVRDGNVDGGGSRHEGEISELLCWIHKAVQSDPTRHHETARIMSQQQS